MAAATWPGSLQQTPDTDGFKYSLGNNTITSQTDVGPAKKRRRSTAAVKPVTYVIFCTEAQRATLTTFFVTTLQHGALAFDWTDYTDNSAAELRFRDEPEFSALGGTDWRVTLPLEVLP